MIRLSCVVIAIFVATGTASAQPNDAALDNALKRVDIDVDAWLQTAGPLFDRLEAASPALADVARGAVRRARRKVSIGPTLGLFGSYTDVADAALTFGIGVEVFKIPVLPTLENLKLIVRERAKAKLKQAIIDTFKGQPPDEASVARFAEEAWTEAVKEILGMENIRAKTMERPQFSLALEGNRYFDASTWATRLRLGVGVWKVTLAASVGAAFTDPKTNAYLGPEVVVHFLMSKGGRASVLDVFLRADFELRSRGETYSQDVYSLGVRYLLDII
jgi:hypothetical protein